jgi:hypothetical protein
VWVSVGQQHVRATCDRLETAGSYFLHCRDADGWWLTSADSDASLLKILEAILKLLCSDL